MRLNGFLYGENIYLRGLVEEDIDGNYQYWFNDKEVCRGNSHHKFPKNKESLRKYIYDIDDSVNKIVLAIIDKSENIHIGNVSLNSIHYLNRNAEFSIIVGEKDYWGKGYGKEAAALIINHGFNSLNLNKINCGTYDNNIAMQKIALSLGFKKEGIRRQDEYKDGRYVDIIEYGLLKSEWDNSKFL